MANNKLEDIFDKNTKILFCGMAPGQKSCEVGHYYANTGNRFWRILYEAHLIEGLINPSRELRDLNYDKLKKAGIGLTDLVKDQCGMDSKIKFTEKDRERLLKLMKDNKKIKILIFNGKKPASKFLQIKPKELKFEYQKEKSKELGVDIYIMPSTSGVNTRFTTKDLINLLKSYINNKIYA